MILQKYKIGFILDLVFYWYSYSEHFYKLQMLIDYNINYQQF